MNKKYNIIAVMGKAGAGKDSFVNTIFQNNYLPWAKPIISCTTRPMRENEQNGINYHFLTVKQFEAQVKNKQMLEISVFNNWYYGTSLANIDEKALNIGVFNPEGVESLRNNPDIDLFVVYIIADDKVRLLRQLNREESPDCHEIVRRFSTDEQDFNESRIELINPDCIITNNDKQNIDDLAKKFIMDYYNILGKIL